MHKLMFYNIGNADCVRIQLENGKQLLFDYAHMGDPSDANDLRCDLPEEIRDDMGEQDRFDVVAFTHLDRDHYAGATEFFYFDHIKKFQQPVDGRARMKMTILWVPAAVITEKLAADAEEEAKAIQKEARERFKAKKGIRVFSRPARLKEWCEANGVDFASREHLVTDAGKVAPEFKLVVDGVEFFVHSPFAVRQDDHTVEDRNEDALIVHATFEACNKITKLFLASDVGHELLTDIVTVTEAKKNQQRLEWDVFKLPHHCSHHSLSEEERKGDKSKPEPKIKRLFEHYSQAGCIVVSTSTPIPAKGSEEDAKGANPPHRQAANYYKEDVIGPRDGEFVVTMEHPSKSKPRPLVIEIGCGKAKVLKRQIAGAAAAVAVSAPRAGRWR